MPDKNAMTIAPWHKLSLGVKWDAYMDRVFATAKDNDSSFMNEKVKHLRDAYTSQTERDKVKDNPKKTLTEKNNYVEWARLQCEIEAHIPPLAVHIPVSTRN
jgi:hypothetical protein